MRGKLPASKSLSHSRPRPATAETSCAAGNNVRVLTRFSRQGEMGTRFLSHFQILKTILIIPIITGCIATDVVVSFEALVRFFGTLPLTWS